MSGLYLSHDNPLRMFMRHYYTAIAELKRHPVLPKNSPISRLTLRFASRQIALRMNAQKRRSLANNSDFT
jgi:hypothetical protein